MAEENLPDEPLLLWLLADTGETTRRKAQRFHTEELFEELLYIGVVRRVEMLSELLNALTTFDRIGEFTSIEQFNLIQLVTRLEPFIRNWQHQYPPNKPRLQQNELRQQALQLALLIRELGTGIWGRFVNPVVDD